MNQSELNILIVEDEIMSIHYLMSILESLGYKNIYDAKNMEDALHIVRSKQIDMVFMDININGSVDGIQCANILNEYCFVPIIFTTAYADSQTILEASNTNSFGYIIKPFEASDVEATLLISLAGVKKFKSKEEIKPIKKDDSISLSLGQKYNTFTKTFYINNVVIDLTKMELNVLHLFCTNLNRNMSYDILREKVWENKDISNSTIRDTISRLKRKTPNLNIENVINHGYILKT